jgi:hypothetical protein
MSDHLFTTLFLYCYYPFPDTQCQIKTSPHELPGIYLLLRLILLRQHRTCFLCPSSSVELRKAKKQCIPELPQTLIHLFV